MITSYQDKLTLTCSLARLQSEGRIAVAHLSAILTYVCDINIAKHVDLDAVRTDSSYHPPYLQAVEKARRAQRTLEVSVQALYDDAVTLFSAVQAPLSSDFINASASGPYDYINNLARTLLMNLDVTIQTLELLWMLGRDQAELAQTVYSSSIEWRQSRVSVSYDPAESFSPRAGVRQEEEDVVDMELAFSRPGVRAVPSLDTTVAASYHAGSRHASETSLDMSDRSRSEGAGEPLTPTWPSHEASDVGTLVASHSPEPDTDGLDDETGPLFDDEGRTSAVLPLLWRVDILSQPRTANHLLEPPS